jgi:hypothetical protein
MHDSTTTGRTAHVLNLKLIKWFKEFTTQDGFNTRRVQAPRLVKTCCMIPLLALLDDPDNIVHSALLLI